MKSLIFTLALVATVLAGCTAGTFDLKKTAETSIHLKLLDAEFDRAVAAVRSAPLNASERLVIDQSIAELQIEREFLRTLDKQNAGRIALTGVQAQTHLDEITEAYLVGREVYVAYLERTGQQVTPLLRSFDDSAHIAYSNVKEAIDSGQGVTGTEMAQYLTLALRTIAAVNGVPLV